MPVTVDNTNFSIRFSLTCLKLLGLWAPAGLTGWRTTLYYCYTVFIFMLILGTYLIIQLIDLCLIWGDLPLMTSTAFLLCTNLVHSVKILNLLARRQRIRAVVERNNRVLGSADGVAEREIIMEYVFNYLVELDCIIYVIVQILTCNRGTKIHLFTFLSLTSVTTVGLAAGADSQRCQLPLRAWYPYDWRKSPAYELTYLHQICAIYLAACLNVSKDILVVSLIAQCRCRLRLVALALSSLCEDMRTERELLTKYQEVMVSDRLRGCVREHQDALATVCELQLCFSEPTLAQFTVSLVIICVTALQLTAQTSHVIRMVSMATYLLNMTEQVFIYCYEGNKLVVESENVSRCAYSFPWYSCGVRVRRSALLVMTRCCRTAKLTAAGFTTLSLASFMSILKVSYTFFTVLHQVIENN